MTDETTADTSAEQTSAADESAATATDTSTGTASAEMAASTTSASTDTTSSAVVTASKPQITLREFMTRLSLKDKRVELINGFNYSETAAGRVKDYESEFASRFTAFSQQIIKD